MQRTGEALIDGAHRRHAPQCSEAAKSHEDLSRHPVRIWPDIGQPRASPHLRLILESADPGNSLVSLQITVDSIDDSSRVFYKGIYSWVLVGRWALLPIVVCFESMGTDGRRTSLSKDNAGSAAERRGLGEGTVRLAADGGLQVPITRHGTARPRCAGRYSRNAHVPLWRHFLRRCQVRRGDVVVCRYLNDHRSLAVSLGKIAGA